MIFGHIKTLMLFFPGTKRRANRVKETPESSPERTQKAKMAAKVRDDARKKMLAEKRAAMKKQQQEQSETVEIYVPENKVSDSPERTVTDNNDLSEDKYNDDDIDNSNMDSTKDNAVGSEV